MPIDANLLVAYFVLAVTGVLGTLLVIALTAVGQARDALRAVRLCAECRHEIGDR